MTFSRLKALTTYSFINRLLRLDPQIGTQPPLFMLFRMLPSRRAV